MRVLVLLMLLATAAPAQAELLRATRDTAMCKSAGALAKLALPHGGSSYKRGGTDPGAERIARAGACDAVTAGTIVILLKARTHTSVVRIDSQTGDGVLTDVLVPNIDFAPYSPPADAFWNTVRARCPALLDVLAAGEPGTSGFVESLPAGVKAGIERQVEADCDSRGPCMIVERRTAIRSRKLEPQWASFDCAHPADATEPLDRGDSPIRD